MTSKVLIYLYFDCNSGDIIMSAFFPDSLNTQPLKGYSIFSDQDVFFDNICERINDELDLYVCCSDKIFIDHPDYFVVFANKGKHVSHTSEWDNEDVLRVLSESGVCFSQNIFFKGKTKMIGSKALSDVCIQYYDPGYPDIPVDEPPVHGSAASDDDESPLGLGKLMIALAAKEGY